MEISTDQMHEDHRCWQNQDSYTQEGTRYIYYCGDDCERARLVHELNCSPEEECDFTYPCAGKHSREEARLLAGAEPHINYEDELPPSYQVHVVGGEEIASNALEIIRVVDDLLSQATCLKQRLVVMLESFQTKVCKCIERNFPCEAAAIDNRRLECECPVYVNSERERGGGPLPAMPIGLSHGNTKEKLSPASPKHKTNKVTTRTMRNDKEQKPVEQADHTAITSAMSVVRARSTTEFDLRAPPTDQKPGKSKTRLGAGHATGYSSAIMMHRKEHEVIQLRDVSRQLLSIQQEIQMLRDQVAKLSCQTACHMATVDTSDNENLLEEVMSANLIGRADEIKRTLTEIKSDCYQKLSPSSGILPRLGEKKVHEKIEREIKRSHPDFSRTINQVKLTTGEKILERNVQHTTFDQTCETNIDTQRRDGSASKNMAFKVMKKTDEKIHNPYSEGERRETLKQSKKMITTEDKAINEEDTINEQQINSADKRTIATHRYVTRTEQVIGREPLKEVLLNVQINRTIDNKTGEVVETMQELNSDASPTTGYHKQNERGEFLMQPHEVEKSGPFLINEINHLTQERIKSGSAACNSLQSTRRLGQCGLSSKVASYFEILADGQEIRQNTRGERNDHTGAAMRNVYDDGRIHNESLRSKRWDIEIEAKNRHDQGRQMDLNSAEHFEQQSSPKYDQKSRFDMESRKSKQVHPPDFLSEKCPRYVQDLELSPTENRCTEAAIQQGERNEKRSDRGEAFRLSHDQRSSHGGITTTSKRPEDIYQPSKHTTHHDDVKSQYRSEAGGYTSSGRSYQGTIHSQNQTFSGRSNATDQQSYQTRDTRAAAHKTEFTRQGDDEQSRYDEVKSFKLGREKHSQAEDNVTQYSAIRSKADGAIHLYGDRYLQDHNDNEGRSQKNRFEPASEWQSNTTRYRNELRSDKLSQIHAHSQEEHHDGKSRASDGLEHIIIDPGTDQSARVSVGGTTYQTKASISDQVAEGGTVTGPYFYKMQSELKLLTDSKLDRICARRANQRILGGANSTPRELYVLDGNDQRRSEVGNKEESNRSKYKPSMTMKTQVGQAKSNLKPQIRPFHSAESDNNLAFQAPHKMLAAKSHITIDPKFYYSETGTEPPILNDRIASQSNFDAAKSELSSQNLSSERNSELVIKQDLQMSLSELAQQEMEAAQLMPSNLNRSTEPSRKTRLSGGKSNSPMPSNGQGPHESYPANDAGISQAEASLQCSPLIKSIRIDCIPRVIDELSGRRCPKDFFISVVQSKGDVKTFRVNIIDKQNGDILGYFLIDEAKFQRARDEGLFDNFLTLYVLNSTVSAANLENRTNLMAANKPTCLDQCPCHGKHRSTIQS